MSESRLYLKFLKSYWLLFVFTLVIGVTASLYTASFNSTKYISERLFQFQYTLENAAVIEKESEQVVTVLRSNQVKEQLGLQNTEVQVYKPGPFAITIQVKSENAENSVNNLSKLSGYLTQNYQATEIGKETVRVENPNYSRFLLIGALGGCLTGLLLSLLISYFKSY